MQIACPNCDSKKIGTEYRTEDFAYGEGAKSTKLRVKIPVRRCSNCGLEYEDHEAFDVRHGAICDHLGVMRPAQVRQLRIETYGTREAFAAATGIGTASLARWESGTHIQSPAYDRYMRLLGIADVRAKLVETLQQVKGSFEAPATKVHLGERFMPRLLNSEMMAKNKRAANQFALRGARALVH